MQEVKDKPSISPRSREIALNSDRFAAPIFTRDRYKLEVDNYITKKEEAARTKYLNQREKELQETQEMVLNSVHKSVKD